MLKNSIYLPSHASGRITQITQSEDDDDEPIVPPN